MTSEDVGRASVEIEGVEISFETGKLAKQASGAVVVRSGETMVLCTATAGNPRDVDFLPLTVDVEERMYAAGKIPGSFFKREGRPSEKGILTARMIDRPIRPLFPKGWTNETQIVATPMCVALVIRGQVIGFKDQQFTVLVGSGAHVIANLPYNVGTALLLKWLGGDWPPWWRSLTLMFQKEVAERIVAEPGSEAYGRLSVAAQWRSRARIAMTVNRSAFVPPPKVTSAVVHIVPAGEPASVDFDIMQRITAAAFGQRRKMLRSSLKSMPGALEAAQALGINTARRAETISVDEWISLALALSD